MIVLRSDSGETHVRRHATWGMYVKEGGDLAWRGAGYLGGNPGGYDMPLLGRIQRPFISRDSGDIMGPLDFSTSAPWHTLDKSIYPYDQPPFVVWQRLERESDVWDRGALSDEQLAAINRRRRDLSRSFTRALQDAGYDSVINTRADITPASWRPGDPLDYRAEVVVLDPSHLRSPFAAFDPAKRNSNDLLAGLTPVVGGAGVGAAAGAALSGQDAEASSLDGEGFDLSSVVMPVLGATLGAAGARSVLRAGGGEPRLRPGPRGAQAFSDARLSADQNKAVEMLRNGFSRAEVADEMDWDMDYLRAQLSRIRARGVEIERLPRSGVRKDDMRAAIRDILRSRGEDGSPLSHAEVAERLRARGFEATRGSVAMMRHRDRLDPSDRLASIAVPAVGTAGLGALVLGGDEAEAQGLGPGFGPMPEGIDVREGRWVGERYPVTLPDGTEAFEQDLALPDGRRLRIVRSQSADGSVTVHGAYPARVVDPRDEIYESGDNYRLPYSAAVEEVEKPGWLAPAMSALPVLALFGGRVGPHITGRWGRFNPRQASAVGGAAFAGAGGAAIGAATEDEDMLDLTGLGAISGGAIGVAPRAGVDLLDNVRRTMPPIRLRVPRAKVRAQDLVPTRPPGAPSERVMDLDEAVIEAEFDLMRREGRRTLRATPAQRRLKRGSDMSLEERAAIPDGDRGSLSNRIGALNADQLRNLARELGLDTTGTKRALAARIASAAREGGEGVYARIRHLYPYL